MTSSSPRRPWWLIALGASALVTGCATSRPDKGIYVATGTVAHNLCSETFVSGFVPEETFAESIVDMPGFDVVRWGTQFSVDRKRGTVSATFLGGYRSDAAYFGKDGCRLVYGEEARAALATRKMPDAPAGTPETDPEVQAADPRLRAVVDAAFADSANPPYSQTKALVVMRDGHIIAERYATGYTIDTPILGFSLTKSVTNALVGVLVRDGRLDPQARAPIAAWQGARDPRRVITLDDLMRMSSGLDLDEAGGNDPSNRMFYEAPDMAAFAEQATLVAPPGSRWAYSSASVHLVSRIVRDAVGGTGDAVQQFAQQSLFTPLGMRHVTLEADRTGTPVGAHYMLASARDWARLGQLYLDDGRVDGKPLLPAGWVRASTTPTLNTDYGAGWWVNRRGATQQSVAIPQSGMPLMPSVPGDTFYALGNLGQYIAVVPSQRLVVVRLGRSHRANFGQREFETLLAGVIATMPAPVVAPAPVAPKAPARPARRTKATMHPRITTPGA